MRSNSLIITIGITLIAIGGILAVNYLNIKEKTAVKEVSFTYEPVPGEIIFGDINAPVKIVEFGSYTCPHCGEFYNVVTPQIKKELIETGEAVFIYRHLPLDAISNTATNITTCSTNQQAEILDVIYKNQEKLYAIPVATDSDKRNVGNALYTLLSENGITITEDEKTCAFSAMTQERNALTMQSQVEKFQLEATPTIIVNGVKLVGVRPAQEIIEIVRSER